MHTTDIYCFYGFGVSDFRKEKSSVKEYNKRVIEYENMFCLYPLVVICCPTIDCCWVKDYATLGVKSFQKFKGVSVLFNDYPFLRGLYEK